MKSKIMNLISILVVFSMSIYPISFLKYAFTNYSSLKVLVGTEYDVSITAAWVVGSLIYLVLSLQKSAEKEKIKNILGGIVSSYSIAAIIFSHQNALTQFNRNNRCSRFGW